MRTHEDDIVAAFEEVEGEDALEGGSVQCGWPIPVPVGERLEASESGALEAALDAAAVLFFGPDVGDTAIASQADRAVDMADGTGPPSSRTPHTAAEQTGPQVLRAPVAAALSSPPPDPLPGLAAALRGLTHKAAIFPNLYRVAFTFPRISVTVDKRTRWSTTTKWKGRCVESQATWKTDPPATVKTDPLVQGGVSR